MMFRIAVVAVVVSAALAAPVQAQMVGGGRDAHGCLSSAGYSWSDLRKTCLRVWEAGVRLDPVTPQGLYSSGAFVVSGPWYDHHRVELFLSKPYGSFILEKAHGAWRGNGYILTRHDNIYTLTDDQGHPLYSGPPAAPK